jgi:hypothetical protein
MQPPTYTTAQIHRRLRVPVKKGWKPFFQAIRLDRIAHRHIRNWSAEYADYLSEQAISERDQALAALGDAQQQIAVMREQTGQLRGLLIGVSMGGVGLLLIAVASTAGLLSVIIELKP